ncbi:MULTISPECIES: HlyD family efflux transporter periplasmic adaptor subunit [unclassified Roseitalea]|uniref:efflux RND transporter periplasmic adaptor subunit n=1 Tax=unclassified Roseitalea TaxID=2639107 RepID=UPI00273E8B26|nr:MULTISPECIES: HlyD family efflux transporter periplasmic adaptor subunit [unclassified Roseitalea]
MKRAWTRWLFGIVVLAIVGYGIYVATREQPVLVDLGTVERGAMAVTIEEEGVTRVRDVYSVSSTVAGNLDRIALEEGDVVDEGAAIAAIRPLDPPFIDERTRTELQAAIEAAQSAVALAKVEYARAQTALELARSDYERAQELARTNVVSERELERARGELQLQEAQVESALANIDLRLAELESARARLAQPGEAGNGGGGDTCCVTLRAPIDGVVLSVDVRSEQAVGVGTVVAELGRPDDLEVAVDLLSSDAVRIGAGTKATITDWGGEALSGTVRKVEPAAFTKVSALGIEEQRVNVIIDLDAVPAGLGHGYRVVTELTLWESGDVLHMPIGALFRSDGQWAVFVAEGDVARLRTVEVGRLNDTSAQVLGGLEEGERVVVFPSDVLRDGRRIEDRTAGGA